MDEFLVRSRAGIASKSYRDISAALGVPKEQISHRMDTLLEQEGEERYDTKFDRICNELLERRGLNSNENSYIYNSLNSLSKTDHALPIIKEAKKRINRNLKVKENYRKKNAEKDYQQKRGRASRCT